MRKRLLAITRALLTAAALPVLSAPALAQAAPAAHYSVETTLVGKLIDDPAAAAILHQLIPTVWANELFQSQGRELTLKAVQQYEPEALSAAILPRSKPNSTRFPPGVSLDRRVIREGSISPLS